MKKAQLAEINWPEFGLSEKPASISLEEFQDRIDIVQTAMKKRGYSHLLIYGDREHFANMTWMCNLDPRFEEALLIVSLDKKPLILIGNECEGYLPHSPLYNNGDMRSELYQPFSLLNQGRDKSRTLNEIFLDEGINEGSLIGCVGWKYFESSEEPAGIHAIDIPSFITDPVRNIAGYENVENATDLFMHPGYGFRTIVSVDEIAIFEHSNIKTSEAAKRMIFGLRDGMVDHDVAKFIEWDGEPLGCHPTMSSGDLPGLCGPQGRTINIGDPFSFNVCYWGSNICRSGWVVNGADELPAQAQAYIDEFAGPYFEAMADWFGKMSIGTKGSILHDAIYDRLPFDKFGIFLNAGHLIHLDEWVSSPIYESSDLEIRSGMMFQVDVIPSSPIFGSTRMEDGIVIADEELRSKLKEKHPNCYDRCMKRREFMIQTLGFDLPEEILPLSNIAAIVPPWFLNPSQIFILK
ncbi:MAG: M24 family metallopeptidase [Kordiimonadaceae bacterium]|jgi:Xaa-Pro aminopeptidase|nr:M24 family metallopeptidase [Kordiimonadaceae bacterium]MBT6030956.1 M24 family metallopeptidase [Kordiimonadaceae bacterium]MBT6328515.1 M24 family metallopeptidase [Kordiimonadaceae bacterium]MBT7582427.1 M24 family metallopeptidase [Kordiimonadaceae bacterium]